MPHQLPDPTIVTLCFLVALPRVAMVACGRMLLLSVRAAGADAEVDRCVEIVCRRCLATAGLLEAAEKDLVVCAVRTRDAETENGCRALNIKPPRDVGARAKSVEDGSSNG